MRALVIGGTGQVGRAAMTALAARHPGPGGMSCNLRDPASVTAAARGFDTVYFQTPLGADESAVGVAAVAALRAAGVAKLVYLGIMNLDLMAAIPHFATKRPVRDAVLADGRSVMIAASFFMANDLLMKCPRRRLPMRPIPPIRAHRRHSAPSTVSRRR